MRLTRDEIVARLIKAGELEVIGGDQGETDSYFDTERFRFHGPDGFEADYGGLTNYFKSIREAFEDRSIRRASLSLRVNRLPARRGSRENLSASSRNRRPALCPRTDSASSGISRTSSASTMKVVWSRSGYGPITGASFASSERRGDRQCLSHRGATAATSLVVQNATGVLSMAFYSPSLAPVGHRAAFAPRGQFAVHAPLQNVRRFENHHAARQNRNFDASFRVRSQMRWLFERTTKAPNDDSLTASPRAAASQISSRTAWTSSADSVRERPTRR